MSKDKNWVDKNHYRTTSDDGKTSHLYKFNGVFSSDTCVEIAEHHSDGTTDAYEVGGFWDSGMKGAKKNT